MGYSPPLERFVSYHDEAEERPFGIDYWAFSERQWVSGVRWHLNMLTDRLFEPAAEGGLQVVQAISSWLSEHAPGAHLDFYPPRTNPLDKLDEVVRPWTVSVKFDRDRNANEFIDFIVGLASGQR